MLNLAKIKAPQGPRPDKEVDDKNNIFLDQNFDFFSHFSLL